MIFIFLCGVILYSRVWSVYLCDVTPNLLDLVAHMV